MQSSASATLPVDRANPDGPSLAERLADLEWHRSFDVDARLGRARQLEQDATAAGDDDARMRARLVIGDMLHRTGDTSDGARVTVEVHTWATAHRAVALLARTHLVLSSIFESIGDPPSSLDHAVRAIDLLDETASQRERGNYLLRLADALAYSESEDQARRRYHEAALVFGAIGDRERLLTVLNNLTVLESEIGDPAKSRAAADQLDRAIEPGEMNSDYAETIARARLVGGDAEGAERVARLGLDLLAAQGDTKANAPAELELTHAEVLLALGRPADAQSALDRCLTVCEERNLAGLATQAIGVQAEVFASCGDYEHAYRTHREFHAASMRLRSHQQEAAARTREALFETAEARREAERFKMQARIDPLTELYNRRFVDETLPRWLASGGGPADRPLTVAIIDIDHFKQINDELSHAVGDEVLRHLANLLARSHGSIGAAPLDSGFAARIGGEEFVVADGGHSPDAALDRIDVLRRTVETYDWDLLAPGLRVTISAGVAVAHPGDTQRTLLERADRHLYAAKTGGRNRVVAGD